MHGWNRILSAAKLTSSGMNLTRMNGSIWLHQYYTVYFIVRYKYWVCNSGCVCVSDIRVWHPADEEPEASITRSQLQPEYENRTWTGGESERQHHYYRSIIIIIIHSAVMHIHVSFRWHQGFMNMFLVQLTKRSKWVWSGTHCALWTRPTGSLQCKCTHTYTHTHTVWSWSSYTVCSLSAGLKSPLLRAWYLTQPVRPQSPALHRSTAPHKPVKWKKLNSAEPR